MSAKENSLETFNSKINKILVISDTHQNCYSDIDNEIKKQILIADLVIHCGDITSHDVINGIKENKDNKTNKKIKYTFSYLKKHLDISELLNYLDTGDDLTNILTYVIIPTTHKQQWYNINNHVILITK